MHTCVHVRMNTRKKNVSKERACGRFPCRVSPFIRGHVKPTEERGARRTHEVAHDRARAYVRISVRACVCAPIRVGED